MRFWNNELVPLLLYTTVEGAIHPRRDFTSRSLVKMPRNETKKARSPVHPSPNNRCSGIEWSALSNGTISWECGALTSGLLSFGHSPDSTRLTYGSMMRVSPMSIASSDFKMWIMSHHIENRPTTTKKCMLLHATSMQAKILLQLLGFFAHMRLIHFSEFL